MQPTNKPTNALIQSTVLLLGVTLSPACGTEMPLVSPSLLPYVENWLDECEKNKIVDCKLKYSMLESIQIVDRTIAGIAVCNVWPNQANRLNDFKFVTVDRDWWNRATEIQKRIVITHEFGHCILNRMSHTEEGVMNPYIRDDSYYTSQMEKAYWEGTQK